VEVPQDRGRYSASPVGWFLTALSTETGYIVLQKYEMYCVGPGTITNTQQNNETAN